jgi:hypothetical protein
MRAGVYEYIIIIYHPSFHSGSIPLPCSLYILYIYIYTLSLVGRVALNLDGFPCYCKNHPDMSLRKSRQIVNEKDVGRQLSALSIGDLNGPHVLSAASNTSSRHFEPTMNESSPPNRSTFSLLGHKLKTNNRQSMTSLQSLSKGFPSTDLAVSGRQSFQNLPTIVEPFIPGNLSLRGLNIQVEIILLFG